MAIIPQKTMLPPTVEAIHAAYLAACHPRLPRRLCTTQLGTPCDRALWYAFRWSSNPVFVARQIRCMDMARTEGERFICDLKAIGCTVYTDCGEFPEIGGHLVAKPLAVAEGIPEAPKTPHLVMTSADDPTMFSGIQHDSVANFRPPHHLSMQVSMKLMGLTRAVYLICNRVSGSIHAERVRYDAKVAEACIDRAKRIIAAPQPPKRVEDNYANNWTCQQCPYVDQCQNTETTTVPAVNCRTCLHSTPEIKEGERMGLWKCSKHARYIVSDEQAKACDDHLFVPMTINGTEVVDAGQDAGGDWVMYRTAEGAEFVNSKQAGAYTSKELAMLPRDAIGKGLLKSLKETVGGGVVEVTPV